MHVNIMVKALFSWSCIILQVTVRKSQVSVKKTNENTYIYF